MDLVQWLIEHDADPNKRYMYGPTPLSIAAQSASLEIVKLLLESGASVQHGYPLHSAIHNNREEDLVKLLLQNGASPNAIKWDGKPEAFYDILAGVGTPLHVAYKVGNESVIQLLLDHGADPNIRDTKGRLPSQIRKTHINLKASM